MNHMSRIQRFSKKKATYSIDKNNSFLRSELWREN